MDWWTWLAAIIALLWIFCFIDGKRMWIAADFGGIFFVVVSGNVRWMSCELRQKTVCMNLRQVSF